MVGDKFFLFLITILIVLSITIVSAELETGYQDDEALTVNLIKPKSPEVATFLPKSFAVTTGVLDDGNVSSINKTDRNYVNVSEAAGMNPMTIHINFTGVSAFSNILMREWYDGGSGHVIRMGIFDCDGGYEEEYAPDITDMSGFAFSLYNVLDPLEHICGGNVSIQLRHVNNGIASHDFFLDYIVLQLGATTVVANEVDPLSLYKDGSTIATGNFNWGGFNISNVGNITATQGFFNGVDISKGSGAGGTYPAGSVEVAGSFVIPYTNTFDNKGILVRDNDGSGYVPLLAATQPGDVFYITPGGDHIWYINSWGSIAFMEFTSAGNLGIGRNANQGFRLEVQGNSGRAIWVVGDSVFNGDLNVSGNIFSSSPVKFLDQILLSNNRTKNINLSITPNSSESTTGDFEFVNTNLTAPFYFGDGSALTGIDEDTWRFNYTFYYLSSIVNSILQGNITANNIITNNNINLNFTASNIYSNTIVQSNLTGSFNSTYDTHVKDNSQAHTDYLLNTADTHSGILNKNNGDITNIDDIFINDEATIGDIGIGYTNGLIESVGSTDLNFDSNDDSNYHADGTITIDSDESSSGLIILDGTISIPDGRNLCMGFSGGCSETFYARDEDRDTIFHLETYSTGDTDSPAILFYKSSSGTLGTKSTTADGEYIADWIYRGVDLGGDFTLGSRILSYQEATAGTGVPMTTAFIQYDKDRAGQLDLYLRPVSSHILFPESYTDVVLGGCNAQINATGDFGCPSSSISLKENVVNFTADDKYMSLRPVSFNPIGSDENKIGLIAEEVAPLYPELIFWDYTRDKVCKNNAGDIVDEKTYENQTDDTDVPKCEYINFQKTETPRGINYDQLATINLDKIQQQEEEIQQLETENGILKDSICQLDSCTIKFDWCGCPTL